MLTPIEVQSKIFKGSGMGYSKPDVDAFFTTVASSYEEVYKENLTLKENINNLNAALSHYKEIEKSLQKALILAETTAEETVLGAKKNATIIEQEAVLKAQTIVADAKIELAQIKNQTDDLVNQFERYKAQYKALATAQFELINSDAYKLNVSSVSAIEGLEKDAAAHMDQLQAVPVSDPADLNKEMQSNNTAEPEEDFDETLSTDDSMIKDFSSMFDNEQQDENK